MDPDDEFYEELKRDLDDQYTGQGPLPEVHDLEKADQREAQRVLSVGCGIASLAVGLLILYPLILILPYGWRGFLHMDRGSHIFYPLDTLLGAGFLYLAHRLFFPAKDGRLLPSCVFKVLASFLVICVLLIVGSVVFQGHLTAGKVLTLVLGGITVPIAVGWVLRQQSAAPDGELDSEAPPDLGSGPPNPGSGPPNLGS